MTDQTTGVPCQGAILEGARSNPHRHGRDG